MKQIIYERPDIGETYPRMIDEFYEAKFVSLYEVLEKGDMWPYSQGDFVVMTVARWPPEGIRYPGELGIIQSATVVIKDGQSDRGLVARVQIFPPTRSDIRQEDISQLFADKVVVMTNTKLDPNQTLDKYLLSRGWSRY